MNKRIVAFALIVFVAVSAFAGCKAKENRQVAVSVTDQNGVVVTDKDGKALTEIHSAQTDKSGNVLTDKNGNPLPDFNAKSAPTSGAAEKNKKTETTTETWKKQSDGRLKKSGVTVDVKLAGTNDVGEGEALIKALIETGLKDSKIISHKSAKTEVEYLVSGIQTTGDNTKKQFFKLQYILRDSTGYLVTCTAQNEKDLGGDFSYITDNLASLATR